MSLVRMKQTRQFPSLPWRWDDLFSDFFSRGPWDDEMIERVWVPRVDIVEDENSYRVNADMPGMKKDDVQITLDDGVLTISGERKSEYKEKDETCHVSERVYGKFSRSFTLRNTIDTDKIDASFKDGVLTVVLPKVEAAKPRKIEIKAH
ncbi:MAG TPA: Hsp20/alpha crystallin family protein [Bacteroidetes bacterium]|nr:Hsp20/alpha crystallin family protein [Bacteroidota bacterium]